MREYFEQRTLTGNIKISLDAARNWVADKASVVNKILSIVTDYQQRGYRLTLRQLYYQLVAADAIPNHDKVYKKIGTILDDCRYSGKLDWAAIEDRGRVPKLPYSVDGVEDAIRDTIDQYRLNRQIGQPRHIELWTEKDAISNILYQVTHEFHVRLVINKGYTSSSAMYQAYQRFVTSILAGQPITILYFGDHDPSGLDMVRDIKDRLLSFFCQGTRLRDNDGFGELIEKWWSSEMGYNVHDLVEGGYFDSELAQKMIDGEHDGDVDRMYDVAQMKMYFDEKDVFKVISIGLTMEQIKTYRLPHNPAKITDPRAADYIKQHGQKSWEVDALKPDVLTALVRNSIVEAMNTDKFDDMLKREDKEKKQLEKFIKK